MGESWISYFEVWVVYEYRAAWASWAMFKCRICNEMWIACMLALYRLYSCALLGAKVFKFALFYFKLTTFLTPDGRIFIWWTILEHWVFNIQTLSHSMDWCAFNINKFRIEYLHSSLCLNNEPWVNFRSYTILYETIPYCKKWLHFIIQYWTWMILQSFESTWVEIKLTPNRIKRSSAVSLTKHRIGSNQITLVRAKYKTPARCTLFPNLQVFHIKRAFI